MDLQKYAEMHGIPYGTMQYWHQRYRMHEQNGTEPARFVALDLVTVANVVAFDFETLNILKDPKMKSISFLLVIAFVILSTCTNATRPSSSDVGSMSTDGKGMGAIMFSRYGNFGRITIGNRSIAVVNGMASRTEFRGYFHSDTTTSNKVDGGTVTLAGQTLGKTVLSGKTYYSTSASTSSTDGVFASINISGNTGTGIPAIVDSIYVPEVFDFSSPSFDVSSHAFIADRSSGLTLTWNDDSNIDSVIIAISYLKSDDTTSFGDWPNRYWWIKTPDDGSYSIPNTVIDDFTAPRDIQLVVIRNNFKVVTASGKDYGFLGQSVAYFVLALQD